MVLKTCRDCKKEFEAKKSFNSKYAKQYCDACSKDRKKAYGNIHSIKASDCEEE